MNTDELRQHLDLLSQSLQGGDEALLKARLSGLLSAYPFNEYEYLLMFLLDRRVIGFDNYENLRSNYVSANKYLGLYGLAPRVFGEIWAHQHIMDLDESFTRPSRSLDPHYEGQYDLRLEGVRVEVKACRAINTKKRGELVSKALRYGSTEPFWMNYQQLKPDACDVFIFIGVWVDRIVYWVLSSDDVRRNRYLSHQHRGGIEYQIGITQSNIQEFDIYEVKPAQMRQAVLDKST